MYGLVYNTSLPSVCSVLCMQAFDFFVHRQDKWMCVVFSGCQKNCFFLLLVYKLKIDATTMSANTRCQ